MQHFDLSVVNAERKLFEDKVESLVVPAYDGYMGILANHEAMIISLKAGIVEFLDKNNQRSHVSIGGGFLEISDNHAILLAEDAQFATEIDVVQAERILEEARKALRGEPSEIPMEKATEELERALSRIKAAQQSK